jgi:hypothetical protein
MRVLLSALLTMLLVGCSDGFGSTTSPEGYAVRYEIYSNCQTSVTLSAANGGTEQFTINASWPWWYERSAMSRDFLYISGQVRCRGGTITTRIMRWDGLGRYVDKPGWYTWRQNSSSGDFVISTTSGSY